jgi:hypothetical protein
MSLYVNNRDIQNKIQNHKYLLGLNRKENFKL